MDCSKGVSGNNLSGNDVLSAGISKYLAHSQKHFELQILLSFWQAETFQSEVLEQEKSKFLCTNVTSNGMFLT